MTQPHPQHPLFGKCLCGKDMRWSDHKDMWYCSEHGWFDHDANYSATHTPAAPAERLCDECNILEVEQKVTDLEQQVKDEREYVLNLALESLDYLPHAKNDTEFETAVYVHAVRNMLKSLRGGGA